MSQADTVGCLAQIRTPSDLNKRTFCFSDQAWYSCAGERGPITGPASPSGYHSKGERDLTPVYVVYKILLELTPNDIQINCHVTSIVSVARAGRDAG